MRIALNAGFLLALALGGGAAAANSEAFTDAAGDAGSAPDVTAVAVTNDDNGLLGFAVTVPPSVRIGVNSFLTILLDTDRNRTTGNSRGFDYTIGVGIGQSLFRWNGSQRETVADPSLVRTGNASVSISARAIGRPRSLDLAVETLGFSGGVSTDTAPDTGTWAYSLQLRPLTVDAVFRPLVPRAGRLFALESASLVLGTGDSVDAATSACRARIGSQTLRARGRCRWLIPSNAKGKRLTVDVTASADGTTPGMRQFAFRVR